VTAALLRNYLCVERCPTLWHSHGHFGGVQNNKRPGDQMISGSELMNLEPPAQSTKCVQTGKADVDERPWLWGESKVDGRRVLISDVFSKQGGM